MQTENLNELAAALTKAQGAMQPAKFNRIVNFSGRSYKYADLASIIDAIRKPLSDNGIAWTQTIEMRDGGLILATMLLHTSGQWIASEYPLPSSGKPQEMGSATTYAKRYSLAAIVGIAADDDDDADAAEKGGITVSAPKKPAAKYTDNYEANTKADLNRSPIKPVAVEPPVHPETGETGPHAIVEPDDMKWGAKFVAAIKAAKTDDEIKAWMDVNGTRLDNVAIDAPKIHDRIITNIEVASEALKKERRVSRATIVLRGNEDRLRAVNWCQKAPDGTRIEFKASRRSLSQNAKLWASLSDIAEQLPWHGVKLKAADWKLIFMDSLKQELRIVPNLDGTGFVNLGRSSSDLSKSEMADLLTLIEAFAAQQGVTLHDKEEAA